MRAIDVVMAQEKRIYILIFKVNKLFSFFSLQCFIKEIQNMYSVFLSSYTFTYTRENLGEKAVESCGNTRLQLVFPQHFSFSQTSTRVCIKQLDYELEISIAR